MDILISYTWYREIYNQDTVVSTTLLRTESKSKSGVTKSIREWAKTWTGIGYIEVCSIDTTYGDNKKFCDIKQRKFSFNNRRKGL